VLDSDDDGITVPARRIDTIARELGPTHIDTLKMNIEGAERLAVRGLQGIVAATSNVCISCHDFLADDGGPEAFRTKALIRQFLVEHGFEVESRDDAPRPWTRDYVYGANVRLAARSTTPRTNPMR
jgi:Methyltransferase FkbM domain